MKAIKYLLISDNSAYRLSETVQKYLDIGYELYGLPMVNNGYYLQAVITTK